MSTPILSYLVDNYDTVAGELSAMVNFGRCLVAFSVEFWVASSSRSLLLHVELG